MTEQPASDAQLRKLFALFDQLGYRDRDERIAYFGRVLGGAGSSKELTIEEAGRLIDELEAEALFSDPARMLEAAAAMKAIRKRDLLLALSGRKTAEATTSAGSFDGGVQGHPFPVQKTHEQTLARLLRTGEADVGRHL